MSWEQRIKDGAYTSPSGRRFTFDFENVSRSTEKKHSVFVYPQKEGAFVQDLKYGVRRFPLRMFIHGENYDQDADQFYTALEESGLGVLEHPYYGVFTVYPTTIGREDRLRDAGGQAVFTVEFVESILDSSTLVGTNQRALINSVVNRLAAQSALNLKQAMAGKSRSQFQKFTDKLKQVSDFTKQYVRPVMVSAGIDTSTFDRVHQGIGFLDNISEGDVQSVAGQLNALIRAGESATKGGPGAYIDLAGALIGLGIDGQEQFDIVNFAAESTIGALTVSTGSTTYTTRQQAVDTAASVAVIFGAVTAWVQATK